MIEARVLVSVENHVARVRLNRPDKRNGLDLPMLEGIVLSASRFSPTRPCARWCSQAKVPRFAPDSM
jgi:hypothetical protein